MNNLKLRIFSLNQYLQKVDAQEIMAIDFTILNGIVAGNPVYEKGVKKEANYFLSKQQTEESLAVKKSFEDVVDDDGFLVALNMKIEWFDIFGNPSLVKEQYIPLSTSESAEILTKRRKRQINYLQEAGVRLGVKQYIDLLFGFYSAYLVDGKTLNLLNNYIENGTNEFQTAIENETDKQILQILSTKLPDGDTVKQSILNQIA